MKSYILLKFWFLLLLLLVSCQYINSQDISKVRITNTDFIIDGRRMIITYDIENYSKDAEFFIDAQVFYENGEKIFAKSFSGDINGNIKGGRSKTIIWDMAEDNAEIKGAIYVEITAVSESITEITDMKETMASYSMAGTLIPSLVFPGIGNTRITRKPYWIMGLAGYGSLVSSYLFNKSAASSYDKYKTERNDDILRFKHYDDAVADKSLSLVFGAAAGVIWAADITLLVINHKKQKTDLSYLQGPETSFHYSYKPQLDCNMLTFKIKF